MSLDIPNDIRVVWLELGARLDAIVARAVEEFPDTAICARFSIEGPREATNYREAEPRRLCITIEVAMPKAAEAKP